MRIRAALVILLSLATLTACGPKHATLEDCIETYLEMGKPAEILAEVCLRIQSTTPPEEFDRQYGD